MKLTDDESQLFRELMHDVTPLDYEARSEPTIKKPQKIRKKVSEIIEVQPSFAYRHPKEDDFHRNGWLKPEDSIHYHQSGLQQKTINALKSGQVAIDHKIDLHGLTADSAASRLETAIAFCLENNKRVLLVIHGKGNYANNIPPVLKNIVNQWVQNHSAILAGFSAHPKQGGSGATLVLLKR